MVIISSIDRWASLITMAVISFVSDAIGSTACSFLENRTSRVSWSITRATLDFRSSSSSVACRPASLPYEGRGSCAMTTERRFLATKVLVTRLACAERCFLETEGVRSAASAGAGANAARTANATIVCSTRVKDLSLACGTAGCISRTLLHVLGFLGARSSLTPKNCTTSTT